jgi:hypothetical protein
MSAYQPKTGARCGCKPGIERDNCPNCEGTGQVIDFAAIRASRSEPQTFEPTEPKGNKCRHCGETCNLHLGAALKCLALAEGREAPAIAPEYLVQFDGKQIVQMRDFDETDADQECSPLVSASYPERGEVARSEVEALPINGVIHFNAGAGGCGSIKRIS